ncbi:hypothetical protein AB0D38_34685, partial [Streptomyces sp. NPDC048279]
MVTLCESVSVWVPPVPSSQAKLVPPWADWPERLVIENGLLYLATYGFGWDSPLQSNVFKFVGIG